MQTQAEAPEREPLSVEGTGIEFSGVGRRTATPPRGGALEGSTWRWPRARSCRCRSVRLRQVDPARAAAGLQEPDEGEGRRRAPTCALHAPARPAAAVARRARQRGAGARVPGRSARGGAPTGGAAVRALRARGVRDARRRTSPAECASGWRSCARFSPGGRSCCWTSPSARSTRSPAPRCRRGWRTRWRRSRERCCS